MKKDLRPDSAKIKTENGNNYVGFANLPNQLYRKAVKDGFEFTLMVVGESGLGKSTLINSLFLTDIYGAEYPGPSQRIKKTSKVEQTRITVRESGVQLNLACVDTPGFGDEVNNDKCWDPIIEFIEQQFELYLNAESRVDRPPRIVDTRVHCCLYFIAPSGHGLKPLDVEFMRRLHDKVNIIPLISKADTLTPDECHEFKREILREIELHKINIYQFPDGADDDEARANRKLRERIPFAVIGSNAVLPRADCHNKIFTFSNIRFFRNFITIWQNFEKIFKPKFSCKFWRKNKNIFAKKMEIEFSPMFCVKIIFGSIKLSPL